MWQKGMVVTKEQQLWDFQHKEGFNRWVKQLLNSLLNLGAKARYLKLAITGDTNMDKQECKQDKGRLD